MVVVQRVVKGIRTVHRLQKGQVLADGLLVTRGDVDTSSTLGSPWLAGGDVLGKDCSVLTHLGPTVSSSPVPVLHGCGQSSCHPLPSTHT